MIKICFVLICIFMLFIAYFLNGRAMNILTAIIIPYMFIIIGNEYFKLQYGFYDISDNVVIMILLGLFSFFIGSCVVGFSYYIKKPIKLLKDNTGFEKLKYYNFKNLKWYIFFAEIVLTMRLLRIIISSGFYALVKEEASPLLAGIEGHVFLSAYPLIPIMILYWFKNKKDKFAEFIILFGVCLLALTFVKYHVISIVILSFVFLSLEEKKYFKPGAIVILLLVVIFFVSNYVIDFLVTDRLSTMNNNFYINHLWKYIAGSVIHDNKIFTVGFNSNTSMILKVLYCIVPLPYMFYYGITGNVIKFPFSVGYDLVSTGGEATNVIDFLGFMYPSKGDAVGVLGYLFVLFFMGVIFQFIYINSISSRFFNLPICVIMTYFLFLSFFGVYMAFSVPWELIVWAVITPNFFKNKRGR